MKRTFLWGLFALISATATAQETIQVSVSNPMKQVRTDQPVVISLQPYGDVRSAIVTCDGQEIPCQLDDLDQDDQFDELCFLAALDKKETKRYTVQLLHEGEPRPYPARVYAEMLMRNDKVKEKNRHNNYIESITARGDCANSYNLQHHHGVDFESELNGIRIYFDKRQTLDLYGKFQKRLELQATQFYTSAEQKKEGYGDDVLWVGNTFGLGAFRGWDGKEPTMIEPVRSRTQRIISYGPLRTIVELVDRGWQLPATALSTAEGTAAAARPEGTLSQSAATERNSSPFTHHSSLNMTIRYTQYAGHRDTDVDVFFNKDVKDYRFSTGIIDIKGSEEFSNKRGLRACWGTDYPSTDTVKWSRETLGLAILIPQKNIVEEVAAGKDRNVQGQNYTFVVKTADRHLSYKVAYTSANETFGYHSAGEWFDYVKTWATEGGQPVVVRVSALP